MALFCLQELFVDGDGCVKDFSASRALFVSYSASRTSLQPYDGDLERDPENIEFCILSLFPSPFSRFCALIASREVLFLFIYEVY